MKPTAHRALRGEAPIFLFLFFEKAPDQRLVLSAFWEMLRSGIVCSPVPRDSPRSYLLIGCFLAFVNISLKSHCGIAISVSGKFLKYRFNSSPIFVLR